MYALPTGEITDILNAKKYTKSLERSPNQGSFLLPPKYIRSLRGDNLGEDLTFETKILKAIVDSMACKNCPYPCKAKKNSSYANCAMHWSKILSSIKTDCDWKEVRFRVATEETQ